MILAAAYLVRGHFLHPGSGSLLSMCATLLGCPLCLADIRPAAVPVPYVALALACCVTASGPPGVKGAPLASGVPGLARRVRGSLALCSGACWPFQQPGAAAPAALHPHPRTALAPVAWAQAIAQHGGCRQQRPHVQALSMVGTAPPGRAQASAVLTGSWLILLGALCPWRFPPVPQEVLRCSL